MPLRKEKQEAIEEYLSDRGLAHLVPGVLAYAQYTNAYAVFIHTHHGCCNSDDCAKKYKNGTITVTFEYTVDNPDGTDYIMQEDECFGPPRAEILPDRAYECRGFVEIK